MRLLILPIVLVLVCAGYSAFSFYKKVRISRTIAERTVPFRLVGERTLSLLVLGDSTGVGVGARTPEESLAGLAATAVGATAVDNFSITGARVRDLAKEVQEIRREKYNYILVGIGGNDVTHFGDPDESAAHLKVILEGLPKHDRLVVYMAGNLGATQLFPSFLNGRYTRLTQAFHKAFNAAVNDAGGIYVNLYRDAAVDEFIKDPKRYFAADGFHPSSDGYALWFESIRPALLAPVVQ